MKQHALREVEQIASRAESPEQIGDPLSPYLKSDEAARWCRFDSVEEFRKWAHRWRVPTFYRGRTLLFKKHILDAYLERKTWTLRRV